MPASATYVTRDTIRYMRLLVLCLLAMDMDRGFDEHWGALAMALAREGEAPWGRA